MDDVIVAGQLPTAALNAISERQRSYIDEFTFYHKGDDHYEAWYAGEIIAYWDGDMWLEPGFIGDSNPWDKFNETRTIGSLIRKKVGI